MVQLKELEWEAEREALHSALAAASSAARDRHDEGEASRHWHGLLSRVPMYNDADSLARSLTHPSAHVHSFVRLGRRESRSNVRGKRRRPVQSESTATAAQKDRTNSTVV
jgi:hypothetical protein